MWQRIWGRIKWCFEIPTEFDFVCRENCPDLCSECGWWRMNW